jgi:protein-disulfide isomerase
MGKRRGIPSRRLFPVINHLSICCLFVFFAIIALNVPPVTQAKEALQSGSNLLSPVRGDPKAVVTIEEFSDFQCPFCGRAVATLNKLLAAHPGKVRLVFRHFPVAESHPKAMLAHVATLAAARQGRFWEMHDLVFENMRRVSYSDLLDYAGRLKLDLKAFEADLRDPSLEALVRRDFNEGLSRQVRATPTFFINGRKVEGALPYDLFNREVERAMTEAKK